MLLKPIFLNADFRHFQAALTLVPFLIWGGAATTCVFCGVSFPGHHHLLAGFTVEKTEKK
jgi:hypothetical protein